MHGAQAVMPGVACLYRCVGGFVIPDLTNTDNFGITSYSRTQSYEDGIFSLRAQHSWIFCQLPPFDVALKFAFEVNPSYLYDINNEKLPFGCHAFEKYEYNTFWQKHIKIPL